jgi:non-ribosomal peptide synthetase component E (peptide arylation enzyme)
MASRSLRAALTSGVQQVFGMAEGLLCYSRLDDPVDLVGRSRPLPDEYLGEKICAAVVFTEIPVMLADVNAYLDAAWATHARPDALVAMPSLPTTALGKIDKKAIVAQMTGSG